MPRIVERLSELGIQLPEAPAPVAAYVPALVFGDQVLVSGQVPFVGGRLRYVGRVPSAVSVEEARDAARICAINGLAAAAQALGGDLDRIKGVLRLGVFVASEPDFTGQPAVANGASELLEAIFGAAGRHCRASVGVTVLPLGAPVEVEMTLSLRV